MIEQSSLRDHELLRYEKLTDNDQTEVVCITLRSVWTDGTEQRFAVSVLTGDKEYDILFNEVTSYHFELEDADNDFANIVASFKQHDFGKGVIN